jgi:hypothetical protein
MYVAVPVGELKDFSVKRIPGEEIEAARFARFDQSELGVVVDETVMKASETFRDRIIERADDYSFVQEVVPGVGAIEAAQNSAHVRTADVKGVESGYLVVDADKHVKVFV